MIEVRVTGARRATDRMRRRVAGLERLDGELRAEIEAVAAEAYQAAPKRSGRLAAGITVDRVPKGYRATVGDVVYAPPIHNGWRARNIRPQPYLHGPARSARSGVIARITRRIRRITEHP